MIEREKNQSKHDNAVSAIKNIYEERGKNVWINPGSQKNKTWNNEYIDVIATADKKSDKAWVIEVETEESITDSEAKNQWMSYDKAFTENWYLAIPKTSETKTKKILKDFGIKNCNIITWVSNDDLRFTFSFIPGIE